VDVVLEALLNILLEGLSVYLEIWWRMRGL
jgi:hypothetical protein